MGMVNLKKNQNYIKRGQEEIVGFVIIVVIVSLILVFFLVFSMNSVPQTNSYEVSSFLGSAIHYTTTCQIDSAYLSVSDLVSSCLQNATCSDGQNSCDNLNQTLNTLMKKGWRWGQNLPVKGYSLNIVSSFGNVLSVQNGNITSTYKGAQEILPVSSANITVSVTIYS